MTCASATFGRKAKLSPRQDDWFAVLDLPPEIAPRLQVLPGFHQDPKSDELLVPRNLVLARQDLFEIPESTHVPEVPQVVGSLRLRDYQRDGIRFLLERSGAILADDVGVGKSAQAIATAVLAGHQRILVCGPLVSQAVWCSDRGDPARHFDLRVKPLMGRTQVGPEPFEGADWVFCHYDILKDWFGFLGMAFQPDCIILDEVGILRGRRTDRSRYARNLCQLNTVRRRILLSATPISNDMIEFWPLLDCTQPGAWGSIVEFGTRHASGVRGAYGWEFGAVSNAEEFRARLSHVMLRRTRGAVQGELPPCQHRVIDVALKRPERARYDAVEHDVRAALGQITDGAERIVQITTLCQLLAKMKVKAGVETALRALEAHDRIVVFSWFRATAAQIAKALEKAGVEVLGPIDGSMPMPRRVEFAEALGATAPPAAFVATTGSCSMSLNALVSASAAVFNDLWWVPDILLQAVGRIHREGQTHPVEAYFLRAPGTLDDLMLHHLNRKAQAIEEAGAATTGPDEVGALVDSIKGSAGASVFEQLISGLQAQSGTREGN